MALTTCKECNGKVSDTADACPHCGAPLPGMSDETIKVVQTRIGFLKNRWVAGLAFWPGVAILVWPMLADSGKDAFVQAWGISKWLIGFGVMWYVASEIDRNLFERKQAKKRKQAADNGSAD